VLIIFVFTYCLIQGCLSDECSGLSVRSLPAGHFNMPYEMVREGKDNDRVRTGPGKPGKSWNFVF